MKFWFNTPNNQTVINKQAFALKIALLGAESTGKSELASQLNKYFRDLGKTVNFVPEYLRTWCEQENRTPRQDEQLAIATE
jgi:nicotinamide riboside kinase